MTYEQLITLHKVVTEGSFKAASEVMHKTQPSLSMAIKNLEEEIGFKVLSREDYRPKLTEKGKAFYQQVLINLETFHQLESMATCLKGEAEPTINISIDAICPISQIKDKLQSFFNPEMISTLNLSIDILDGLTEKLMNEECDFAIGSLPAKDELVDAVFLMKVEMIPVIHKDFLKRNSKVTEKDLKSIPQIILKSNAKNPSDKVVGVMKNNQRWFTSDMSSKLQLIENGLGWGRLPSHLLQYASKSVKEITHIRSLKPIDIRLYLIKKSSKKLGANTKKLWDFFQEN